VALCNRLILKADPYPFADSLQTNLGWSTPRARCFTDLRVFALLNHFRSNEAGQGCLAVAPDNSEIDRAADRVARPVL
jgi:hypothetical protein